MKITFKKLIQHAYENQYAIPAISVSNLETIYGALLAAESEASPIILQVAPVQLENQGLSFQEFKQLCDVFANRFTAVEYVIHLDHAESTVSCRKALEAGFDAVMYDGSHQAFDLNLANTIKVRDANRLTGLEAELGALNPEEGQSKQTTTASSHFTDPQEAARFVKQVDIDALAISFGNVHGLYQGKPKLDFSLLTAIKEATNTPLVLHGGSGIDKKAIQKAIALGVSKINFFTECDTVYRNTFCRHVQQGSYMMVAANKAQHAFKQSVQELIKLCMSGGKTCA